MIKTSLLAVVIALATASVAHAGGQAGSVGVGVEETLSGLSGLSLNYDAGKFHVGGFLGYEDPNGPGNLLEIGARFFYHVHSTAMADFSLGGTLGIASASPGELGNATMDRETDVYIEPSFQIRLFIASNVALSFTGGIEIGVADANEVDIRGQVEGIAGIHYYFF